MTAEPLGVLLVGYDGAGTQNHQFDMYEPAFLQHPMFEIRGVCDDAGAADDRRARSREAAQRLGVPYVEDVTTAVQRPGIDVLSVCVAFERRVATIRLAAANGKHVLVDKPMTLTVEDAEDIADAVTTADIVCMPAHHHRFKDAVRNAAAAVADGRIGTLAGVHADFIVARGATRATADQPTVWPLGELMNFALYPIDTIRVLSGLEVRRVSATRGGFFFGGAEDEDFGVLSLTLDGGVIATVSVGRASLTGHLSGGEHRYRLVGSDGMMLVDAQESIGIRHGRQRAERTPSATAANSVDGLLDELAFAIRTGQRPGPGPDDARAALAVTLAARKAADTGSVLDI